LDHVKVYSTLAWVALDILPMQASSILCKQVFSAAKLIATDHCARLFPAVFEKLQVLKLAWHEHHPDRAALNGEDIGEIDKINEMLRRHLAEDNKFKEWELEGEIETLTIVT
jgi:hypothetical protein